MRPVSARITIDAPREQVFDLLLDLAARPAFMDHFAERYQLLREQPVGVGAGARFKLRHAGGWMDSVIAESEPPHRLVERGHGGRLNRVPNVTEWTLKDSPGPSGCEVAVTFWTEPTRLFDRLSDLRHSERRLTRGFRRALDRLRALAEAGDAPERVVVAGGDRLAPI
jgi:uncharacterized protein YndB with AHSA1/START domain